MTDEKVPGALDRMIVREDVLQICYWFQGEGFGDAFTPQAVMPFLQSDPDMVEIVMEELAAEGTLARDGNTYRFSEGGKRKAGVMFYESFTEFQQGTHGECNAGCCDGDEVCDHEHHHHH
ncbi:hypothetical protein [Ovoidimarina sediminis]|uniref:hypothetical protein n=1 Tax=Ovoidimarina sediminis TaxID=3079856 RepID=UPI002908B203|nr:hypothetical protein [Rhodophyticola sp. MJ-SS7]MDU8944324.1 hypothetical protein [Rhodophyticola sp. MJ-SS7]